MKFFNYLLIVSTSAFVSVVAFSDDPPRMCYSPEQTVRNDFIDCGVSSDLAAVIVKDMAITAEVICVADAPHPARDLNLGTKLCEICQSQGSKNIQANCDDFMGPPEPGGSRREGHDSENQIPSGGFLDAFGYDEFGNNPGRNCGVSAYYSDSCN